jgi:hypothetical protein
VLYSGHGPRGGKHRCHRARSRQAQAQLPSALGPSGSVAFGLADQTIFSKTKRPPFFPPLPTPPVQTNNWWTWRAVVSKHHGSTEPTTAVDSLARTKFAQKGWALSRGCWAIAAKCPSPVAQASLSAQASAQTLESTSRGASAMSADAISGFLLGLPQPTTAHRSSPAPTFFYFATPGQHHLYSCRPGLPTSACADLTACLLSSQLLAPLWSSETGNALLLANCFSSPPWTIWSWPHRPRAATTASVDMPLRSPRNGTLPPVRYVRRRLFQNTVAVRLLFFGPWLMGGFCACV